MDKVNLERSSRSIMSSTVSTSSHFGPKLINELNNLKDTLSDCLGQEQTEDDEMDCETRWLMKNAMKTCSSLLDHLMTASSLRCSRKGKGREIGLNGLLVQQILNYVPARILLECRRVNGQWKKIVSSIIRNEQNFVMKFDYNRNTNSYQLGDHHHRASLDQVTGHISHFWSEENAENKICSEFLFNGRGSLSTPCVQNFLQIHGHLIQSLTLDLVGADGLEAVSKFFETLTTLLLHQAPNLRCLTVETLVVREDIWTQFLGAVGNEEAASSVVNFLQTFDGENFVMATLPQLKVLKLGSCPSIKIHPFALKRILRAATNLEETHNFYLGFVDHFLDNGVDVDSQRNWIHTVQSLALDDLGFLLISDREVCMGYLETFARVPQNKICLKEIQLKYDFPQNFLPRVGLALQSVLMKAEESLRKIQNFEYLAPLPTFRYSNLVLRYVREIVFGKALQGFGLIRETHRLNSDEEQVDACIMSDFLPSLKFIHVKLNYEYKADQWATICSIQSPLLSIKKLWLDFGCGVVHLKNFSVALPNVTALRVAIGDVENLPQILGGRDNGVSSTFRKLKELTILIRECDLRALEKVRVPLDKILTGCHGNNEENYVWEERRKRFGDTVTTDDDNMLGDNRQSKMENNSSIWSQLRDLRQFHVEILKFLLPGPVILEPYRPFPLTVIT